MLGGTIHILFGIIDDNKVPEQMVFCKMKIGIIVKEFPPNVVGGTETQAMRLAEQLSKRYDVTVFTKKYDTKRDYVYSGKYQIVRVPNITFNSFLSTLTFVLLAPLYAYTKRADFIICMMIYPNGFLGYVLNKINGTPYISWIRGGDWYFVQNNRIKMWMISKVAQNSHKYPIIAQTESIKKDVLSVYPDANIKIISNGVSISGRIANGDKIYFVGSLEERKGVKYLIQAMKYVNKELVIIGDGPDREKLEKLCEKCNVSCTFRGYINPIYIQEELLNARVLVLPAVLYQGAQSEGLPNVILEAMSVGLPVVATNIAGIPDVIKDGETGFVVESTDVKELAIRICEIANNQSLWEKMSANCLKEVEKYSWDNVIRRIEEVRESCAG